MYLKKVEITGFKSFANKTTLEFNPACGFGSGKESCGITAIVGPNGSGKSNVSDAIKWAMGEQSMKSLRGKKSEDVIFAGSGKKSRMGNAQVTLYFDNSDKRIPLEYSEVTITRKLFRSGDSEYLINGAKTRLLDVIDLLAKAGIGKESYCVINQGMSDSVLHATPIERRGILEDAAGVKQFQVKKDRAFRKLESTKDNMEKTQSLIREIEPHLKMLKRQAERAQQGKDVSEKLKDKQEKLFSYLWHKFQEDKQNFSSEKESLGAKMMNMQREVDKLSDEISKESQGAQDSSKQDELESKRQEIRNELNDFERQIIVNEGRIVVERERLQGQKVSEIVPVDLKYVQERLTKIRADHEQLIKRVESIESLEELQDIKEFARAIQQSMHDLLDDAGKGEKEIRKDNSKEVQEINEKIAKYEKEESEIKDKIASKKTQLEKIEKEITEEIQKEKEARKHFFELEGELRKKQEELSKLKDEYNEAKIKLARIEVREEDLTSEIRSELRCEPGELEFSGEDIDREKFEKDISRLKVQMEQIGGIDPMVVEEYQETSDRFEFLSGEIKDLEKTIESLLEIIKEMDKKIEQEFSKAFEQINKEFTKYFRIIFGGGNAHLTKLKIKKKKAKVREEGEDETEEENLEEEKSEKDELGIDIFSCPPGKKITNLSMLSGGERSLTSIALLFAIISYNPPPFAILDEIEAALDEANSRRFGKILQELSSNTQFIAISHNRETMRQASLLYGVTMGDDGISKLLSVRLDQVGKDGEIKK